MEDINGWHVFLFILISAVINFAFLVLAIYVATERERKYHKIQTQILVKLAQKAGVPQAELDQPFIAERLKILK